MAKIGSKESKKYKRIYCADWEESKKKKTNSKNKAQPTSELQKIVLKSQGWTGR